MRWDSVGKSFLDNKARCVYKVLLLLLPFQSFTSWRLELLLNLSELPFPHLYKDSFYVQFYLSIRRDFMEEGVLQENFER